MLRKSCRMLVASSRRRELKRRCREAISAASVASSRRRELKLRERGKAVTGVIVASSRRRELKRLDPLRVCAVASSPPHGGVS